MYFKNLAKIDIHHTSEVWDNLATWRGLRSLEAHQPLQGAERKSGQHKAIGTMDRIQEHRTTVIAAAGLTVAAVGAYYAISVRNKVPREGSFPPESLPNNAYDAIIVGAGPSGSTAAYYLARSGAKVIFTFPP